MDEVSVEVNQTLKILLIFTAGLTLFLSIGFGAGIMFEKHFGLSKTLGFSSGQSTAAVTNYNQVFREGMYSKNNIDRHREYKVTIEGREFFQDKLETKMEKAYREGFRKGKREVKKGPFYSENRKVEFEGELQRNNITFRFVENVESRSWDSYDEETELTGFANPQKSLIEIKSGMKAWKTDKICNHEMLHMMFPSFSHPQGSERYEDPVYTLDDKIDLRLCNSITKEVLQRSVS